VIGDKSLPFEYLQGIGYEYQPETKKNVYFVGNMGLGLMRKLKISFSRRLKRTR
jgi:hypothetical protein